MKNIASSSILKQAHEMKKLNKELSFARLLRHSAYISNSAKSTIKNDLRNGVVVFEFYKADGTLRVARGTTDCALIPSCDHPTAYPRTIKSNPKTATAFYDLDVQGWRSFRNASLTYIQDEEEINEG